MILLIDNYDSFSYNLYQLVGTINKNIKVIRNDELSVEEIEALHPSHIILSPGPGKPSDSGICEEVIDRLKGKVPMLGVCLGHQAICEVFGAAVTYAKQLMHGKQSVCTINTEAEIFEGLPKQIRVARYHSLAAEDGNGFPEELEIIARTEDGEIMAVKHKKYNIYGLQFHPESILTPDGVTIIKNFLKEEKRMIKEAISKVSNGEDLSFDEANSVIDEIMSGKATPAQEAAFLTALHMKGETVPEISGCAYAMREKATIAEHSMEVIDIVGTGGDKSQSINISTLASFVTAAAGGYVAKHGNRAASSQCGTADFLEALGANLMTAPSYNEQILKEIGFNFLFAQQYHTAMKYVGPVRKEIGIPTVFNILGPLANPAKAELMLLGVYKEELVETIAQALNNLGVKRAMVVYGQDVMDEISVSARTTVCEIDNGSFKNYEIDPADYGFTGYKKEDLKGGSPAENVEIAKKILQGEEGAGRAAVILNAGAAIHITNQVSIEEGIQLAAEAIDSGKAYETMLKYVELTNKLA